MDTNTYTVATSGTTWNLVGGTGGNPPGPPKGLIATQAVQTKKGWLGQIYVDKTIVFESGDAHDESKDAIDEANEHVVAVLTKLFRQRT